MALNLTKQQKVALGLVAGGIVVFAFVERRAQKQTRKPVDWEATQQPGTVTGVTFPAPQDPSVHSYSGYGDNNPDSYMGDYNNAALYANPGGDSQTDQPGGPLGPNATPAQAYAATGNVPAQRQASYERAQISTVLY